jgi:hypothetical protein
MLPRPLANAVIVLVALAFAVNFFAQFIVPSYTPDPAIYGVFGAIAGTAFAQRKAEKANGKGNGS